MIFFILAFFYLSPLYSFNQEERNSLANVEYFCHFFRLTHSNNSSLSTKIIHYKNKPVIESLINESKNYLIILPKQMGCLLCQISHSALTSERYQHYLKRKKQIECFIEFLEQENLDKGSTLNYIKENISNFKGDYGKRFYKNCLILLKQML